MEAIKIEEKDMKTDTSMLEKEIFSCPGTHV